VRVRHAEVCLLTLVVFVLGCYVSFLLDFFCTTKQKQITQSFTFSEVCVCVCVSSFVSSRKKLSDRS